MQRLYIYVYVERERERDLCIYIVFLSGKSQGQRSLVGYSPQNHKELVMAEVTEHAHTNTYVHMHVFYIHVS